MIKPATPSYEIAYAISESELAKILYEFGNILMIRDDLNHMATNYAKVYFEKRGNEPYKPACQQHPITWKF